MRRNHLLQALLLALTLALMLAVLAVSASASETADLDIYAKNLSFENEAHLVYAVKSADPSIKLYVWTEDTLGGEPEIVNPIFGQDVDGVTCTVFKYTGIAAKEMTDNVYVQAVVTDGETETRGALCKYSILQYAYNKLGKTGTASADADFRAMLTDMLQYGAGAQKYFDYKTDHLANAGWVQVKLTGGTLPDGFDCGLYLPGDMVTVTAPDTLDGAPFLYWQDGSEAVIATTPAHDLTVGNVNQAYTAKYGANIAYSQGLAFTSNGDGTCSVSGIGTCTDTDIRIPTVSPDGDSVTSIGNHAFANSRNLIGITIPDSVTSIGETAFYYCTRLTSITIPDSVTSIGGGAFSGCSSLVYNKKGGVEYLGNGTNPYMVAVDTYTNITSVSLPDTVKIILQEAFCNCSSLTSITIPDSVTSIGDYAFYKCSSLTSITIPDSVTSIGGGAFSDCSSLETVTFAERSQLTSIGDDAFCNCSSLTSITIPDSVTSIGWFVFSECSSLETVTFAERSQLTSIGDYAFRGCSSLTSITILGSVTSIGDDAFRYCRSLTSITIPDSVTSIGNDAFEGCSSLETVTFAKGSQLTRIGEEAFYNCSSLTSITIPGGVTSIGDDAFRYCRSLMSITFEGTIEQWNAIAKGNNWDSGTGEYIIHCTDGDIAKDGTVTYKSSQGLAFTSNGDGTCSVSGIGTCTDTYICIPSISPNNDRVTSIGNHAFANSRNLIGITIPDSVEAIEAMAFEGCEKLQYVEMSNGLITINYASFMNCIALEEIILPDSVVYIKEAVFSGCSGLQKITIGNGVTGLGGYGTFTNCSSLTDITFKGTMAEWNALSKGYNWNAGTGEYIIHCTDGDIAKDGTVTYKFSQGLAFTSNGDGTCSVSGIGTCTDTAIVIPAEYNGLTVTGVGELAFIDCSQIESIILPQSVTKIEGGAFGNCSNLSHIYIPDNVRSIGEDAFYRCDSLTSITIPSGVTEIAFYTFRYCSGLTDIIIPNNVKTIWPQSFLGCSGLKSITISKNVSLIGYGAFGDCTALESIQVDANNTTYRSVNNCLVEIATNKIVLGCKNSLIPSGITSIGDLAFCGVDLQSITIPVDVKNIDHAAFADCNNLKTVIFEAGSNLASIGYAAFSNCSSLTSITIPASVTSIGDAAFRGCSSLTSITIGNGVTSIGYSAFKDCSSLTSITFEGTIEQWNAITKGTDWNYDTGTYTIHCTDGDIPKS